jgi:cell division protein YceG involved in septum cleavage
VKRRILLFLAFLVVAGFAAAVTAITVIKGELERTTELATTTVVEIPPGQRLRTTARQLREAGLIASEQVFLAAAWWKRADRSVKHGRHEFEGSVTLASVLEELSRPPKPRLRVTIPEG